MEVVVQIAVYTLACVALLAVGFIGGLWIGFNEGIRRSLDLLKRGLDKLADEMKRT